MADNFFFNYFLFDLLCFVSLLCNLNAWWLTFALGLQFYSRHILDCSHEEVKSVICTHTTVFFNYFLLHDLLIVGFRVVLMILFILLNLTSKRSL